MNLKIKIGDITLNVKFNENVPAEKLKSIIEDASFKTFSHNTLIKWCDQFTPFRTGALSRSGRATSEYAIWGGTPQVRYARRMYYGEHFNFFQQIKPYAGAKWDKRAMEMYGEQFSQDIKNEILRRLKSGQK